MCLQTNKQEWQKGFKSAISSKPVPPRPPHVNHYTTILQEHPHTTHHFFSHLTLVHVMEAQIQQAVEIALSGTADPGLKAQAYDYIDKIKALDSGLDSCVAILTSSTPATAEALRFFVLQVIEENVPSVSEDRRYTLSTTLVRFLRENYLLHHQAYPVYLRNKVASVVAATFCHVYLTTNPQFLHQMLELAVSEPGTDIYVRVLLAIHAEIGDKLIARTPQQQERSTALKDTIRANDMHLLVALWQQILGNSEAQKEKDQNPGQNPNQNTPISTHGTPASLETLTNTLRVVGAYVLWMEIGLFVLPAFITTLLSYLHKPDQRIAACDAVAEIVSKKMKPENKLQLVELLNVTDIVGTLAQNNDDLEFTETVARLANQVGTELLLVLEAAPDQPQATSQLMGLWPLVLGFLGHEYDDVALLVFPFIQQYLLQCKKQKSLANLGLLKELLAKCIVKMKFDEEDDGLDDDAAAEFEEVRARLKTFQDTIAVLAPELYLELVPAIVSESLFGPSPSWHTVELGLYQLANYADGVRNNLVGVPKKEMTTLKPFQVLHELFVRLLDAPVVLALGHPRVQLLFFELVVRHYSFIAPQTNTDAVFKAFGSPVGMFNDTEKVRRRCWYLFFRFIKLVKPQVADPAMVEDMVVRLQPLLHITAEVPARDADDEIVDNGPFLSQLYLFEALGLLIALMAADDSVKLRVADAIFSALFDSLETCVAAPQAERDSQPVIPLQAHHALMAIGTFVRGYDDANAKLGPALVDKVDHAAQVVVITLGTFAKHEPVREASRFAFARLVPILRDRSSAHLSKLILLIISANNLTVTELADFLSFLGQLVHTFKGNASVYQLLNDLLTPVVDKVFALLQYNGENNDFDTMPDIVRNKNGLKKAYMNLVSAIIANNSSSLLVTESNKAKLPAILASLFEYAYDLGDTTVTKLAVTQLINFVTVLGCGGKINDPNDTYGESLPAIEGVDEYLMEKSTHLCFELPFQRTEFDLKDAQFRMVAQEISQLIKACYDRKGDTYLQFLLGYLTTMGMSPELMNEFGSSVVKMDNRAFKKYFIAFVCRLKPA